jgi:hypothetical protein
MSNLKERSKEGFMEEFEPTQLTMNEMLVALYLKWGLVTVMSIDTGLWLCMNKIDEGLGNKDETKFRGVSPLEAVSNAYKSLEEE